MTSASRPSNICRTAAVAARQGQDGGKHAGLAGIDGEYWLGRMANAANRLDVDWPAGNAVAGLLVR